MPITGQDSNYFLTDTGGRIAKAGLSDNKRAEYESMLSPTPAMTPVPPQNDNPYDLPAPSPAPATPASPWDEDSVQDVTDISQLNIQPSVIAAADDRQAQTQVQAPSAMEQQLAEYGKMSEKVRQGIEKGYNMQQAANTQLQTSAMQYNKELAREQELLQRNIDQDNYQILLKQQQREKAVADAMDKYQSTLREYDDAKIDPDRYFGGDVGKRIMAGIAIAMGSFGASLTGGQNHALAIIQKAIDNDIAAQKSNKEGIRRRADLERLGIADLKDKFGSEEEALLARKANTIEMTQRKINEIAARYNSDQALAQAEALNGALEVQKNTALNQLMELSASKVGAVQKAQAEKSEKTISLEDNLRKEREKSREYSQTVLRRDAYATMEVAANSNSAAGDVAFIFAFMKAQDPTSTVRESEFATAEDARGVNESVIHLYNRVIDGERLTPKQRQEFLTIGKKTLEASERSLASKDEDYRKIISKRGLDPEMVIINRSPQSVSKYNFDQLSSLTLQE